MMSIPPGEASPNAHHRIEYLDTYRGLACLLVYFYHTAVNISIFGTPFYGYQGVHLFFVLSGYLMSGKFIPALLGSKPLSGIKKYIFRRFMRIYPPFLVSLIVFVGLRIVSKTNIPDWRNILFHAGLIFNYVDRYDYFSINPVVWSLAIEMQFYVLLPLMVWLLLQSCSPGKRRAILFAILFLAVGIVSRSFENLLIDHDSLGVIAHVRFKWVMSYLDLFGVGILLRVVEDVAIRRGIRLDWRAGVCGLTAGVAVLYLASVWAVRCGFWQNSGDPLYTAVYPLMVCFGFAIMIGFTGLSPLGASRLFRWPVIVWLGSISYSLYLYHTGVYYIFDRVFKPGGWGFSWGTMTLMKGLCCLPVTILIAWVAYRLFERPFYQSRMSAKPVLNARTLTSQPESIL